MLDIFNEDDVDQTWFDLHMQLLCLFDERWLLRRNCKKWEF